MFLCVCNARCDVGMWWHSRTDEGEERDPVFPFFFFGLWTWAVEHSVELVGPRGMGMIWDDMRDYDTRANYCIIRVKDMDGSVFSVICEWVEARWFRM